MSSSFDTPRGVPTEAEIETSFRRQIGDDRRYVRIEVEGHSVTHAAAYDLPSETGPWTPDGFMRKGGKWEYKDGDTLNVLEIRPGNPLIIKIAPPK